MKRFNRMERKGVRNLGGSRTRDEVCGATQERQTVFKYIAERRVEPCPVQHEPGAETKYQRL